MQYDKENDKIVSAVGSDIEIYPLGVSFQDSSEIELNVNGDSIHIPSDKILEIIDGLIQVVARAGV